MKKVKKVEGEIVIQNGLRFERRDGYLHLIDIIENPFDFHHNYARKQQCLNKK
jgi:hypothetical protein